MNFSEEHIELFRAYLDDTLSSQERLAFEKRISEDAEFRKMYEDFQSFEVALRDVETVETYDQVGEWESQYQEPQKKTPMRKLWLPIGGVAAAAALVVVLLLPESGSNAALVSDYFEPYDNVITVRGKKEALDQALSAYDKQDYAEALELLSQYPEDSIGIFYRAESMMALERFQEAREVYDDVIARGGVFTEVAEYHRALAYLGNNEVDKAKKALKEIESGSHYYDRAKDLLERL